MLRVMKHTGSDYSRVARAITFLEANARRQPSLEAVAAHVGLSPFHFQRVFERWAGVSPKRFLQFQSLQHARRLLAQQHSLLDAAHDAGLSGAARLHDLFLRWEAMTPGEFKSQRVLIRYGVHDTPLGRAVFSVTDRGLCGVEFIEDETGAPEALRARFGEASLEEKPRATAPFAEALRARFSGQRLEQPLALLLRGTPFQVKVWEALLRVPEGAVVTYGELARRVGMPTASRAVGTAVGHNPIAVLIPCHRVIQSTGVTGGYRWSPARKKLLLGVEWARSSRDEPAHTR